MKALRNVGGQHKLGRLIPRYVYAHKGIGPPPLGFVAGQTGIQLRLCHQLKLGLAVVINGPRLVEHSALGPLSPQTQAAAAADHAVHMAIGVAGVFSLEIFKTVGVAVEHQVYRRAVGANLGHRRGYLVEHPAQVLANGQGLALSPLCHLSHIGRVVKKHDAPAHRSILP